MVVNGAYDNRTFINFSDGSWPVVNLNTTASGGGDQVTVYSLPTEWWEARFTDPNPGTIPDGWSLVSVMVTVQYEMETAGWGGTLDLEIRTSAKLLGTIPLPYHGTATQEVVDVTSLVNAETDPLATLNDLVIRMVNDDNPGADNIVWWSHVRVDVEYAQSPGGFALTLPALASTDVSQTPTLNWEDSPNATSYSLKVSENLDLSAPVIDQTVIAESFYDVASALDPTTTYYWSVAAVNAFGSTPAHNNDFSFTTLPANLNVLAVVPTNADPDVGQSIAVNVTVQNLGPADAGLFTVGLFLNRSAPPSVGDVPDSTRIVASLDSGDNVGVGFTGVAGTRLETWDMYVLVDSGDDIAESDESDNADGPVAVTWHGPDLVIPMIVPSKANPDAGVDVIDVTVTVRNLGDRVAGAFNVTLFYDETSVPAMGDYPPPPEGADADRLHPGGGSRYGDHLHRHREQSSGRLADLGHRGQRAGRRRGGRGQQRRRPGPHRVAAAPGPRGQHRRRGGPRHGPSRH